MKTNLDKTICALEHLGMRVNKTAIFTSEVLFCEKTEENGEVSQTVSVMLLTGLEMTFGQYARIKAFGTEISLAATVRGSVVSFHVLHDESNYEWDDKRGLAKSTELNSYESFIRVNLKKR